MRMTYTGTLWGLFNPFALLCGLVSVAMITMHGASYLACKTEGVVQMRAENAGAIAGILLIVLFLLGGLWAAQPDFYILGKFAGVDGPTNPLLKEVTRASGVLMNHYRRFPWTLLAPAVAVLAALLTIILMSVKRACGFAFVRSALAVAGVIATAGLSAFPFLLPSSLDPRSSLTVWDSSSSELTLAIVTVATVVILPIVLIYTAWEYRVLRGPVMTESVTSNSHSVY